ncbi:hypothetical protein ACEUAY_09415 [Aeromonas veronii]
MKWITDEDLKTWSRMTSSRELFIDLVADLIRATIGDANKFRFPGQDSGTLRGFDGALHTGEAVSRVPAGKSLWEFGTGSAGKKKAQEDYEKRTMSTLPEVMAENAFVMVNLHSWDTPSQPLESWLAERNAEGKWREVHYIDGTALVSWLEEKPAVAAKYAKGVLDRAPRIGALSTDEYWERYSLSFKPTLSEKVLLCGREEEAQSLLQVFTGGPKIFTLAADSTEEVIAFAVAVIRTAPAEIRNALELRTMIVEKSEAAQFFLGTRNMIFLVKGEAEELAGSLSQRGITLTAVTGVQRKQKNFPTLNRPTASAMAEAMESMGIERQDGYDLAFKCGRSLTILRRLCSASGTCPPAEWQHLAAPLKPALLAGGWSSNSSLDREVVTILAGGMNYVYIESEIRKTLIMSDPPFDNVDQAWQIRSAVDAFPYYGHLIDENDLQNLKEASIRVLSHKVSKPKAEQQFSLSYSAPEDYSHWLRDGLAYTLMLFAIMPDVGGLKLNGITPQHYVDDIIRSLPNFAKSHQWIVPILSQLSIIAEAAPIPFLEALEKSLEGDATDALELFKKPNTHSYLFSETSPHTHVLWALEVLAWDPILLSRVTLILGKLVGIDPDRDSSNGNRPLSSLRDIFLTWSPKTDADLSRRLMAIDRLIIELPDVAWELLCLLMPRHYDTCMSTARPKLRDTTPLEPESLTFGLVWETETHVLNRAISLAQGKEERVVSLVEHLHQHQAENRARLVTFFEENLRLYTPYKDNQLWHKLRDFTAHHDAFPDTDWALKGEELLHIKTILERYAPSDIIALNRYLFDSWHPNVSSNPDKFLEDVEAARVTALKNIYQKLGIHGVIKLANVVNHPNSMSEAFNSLELTFDDAAELIFSLIGVGNERFGLSCSISGYLKSHYGNAWVDFFTKSIISRCKSVKEIAWLLSRWPKNNDTWSFVISMGEDVSNSYWYEVGSIPWEGPEEDIQRAIGELRRVGRSLRVISSAGRRGLNKIDSQTLLSLLDESVAEISSGQGGGSMLSYAISDVFKELSNREDITLHQVAQREYIYLSLIERSVNHLSIHTVLAQDPEEYIGLIRQAFVSKNGERDLNPSEETKARARQSYKLLQSFHTIPGDFGGEIDEAILLSWVLTVRSQAFESGHEDIAEQYIGKLLAHSKSNIDEDTWPPIAVASVLERIASKSIERGIEIERFNMRGVYTKAIGEGGQQERELASTYRQWAKKAKSLRTAIMLERIASEWDENAKREDISAEKDKLKR